MGFMYKYTVAAGMVVVFDDDDDDDDKLVTFISFKLLYMFQVKRNTFLKLNVEKLMGYECQAIILENM